MLQYSTFLDLRCYGLSSCRCDAKERTRCELVWGVQVLQTGDNQGSHWASVHDRTPQGKTTPTRWCEKNNHINFYLDKLQWPHLLCLNVLCMCLQSESYQEDIYPMTAGNKPALTSEEWLSGIDKGQKWLFMCVYVFVRLEGFSYRSVWSALVNCSKLNHTQDSNQLKKTHTSRTE